MSSSQRDQGDQELLRVQRSWGQSVVDPRGIGFGLGLACVCAVVAILAFVTESAVAGSLFSFCAVFFGLVVAARPPQRLRSDVRDGEGVVVRLPPRYRFASATVLAVPLLAALVASWVMGGISLGWTGLALVACVLALLAVLGVTLTGERFRVSDAELERGSSWSGWTTRLSWDAVQKLEYTLQEGGEGSSSTSGFRIEGQAPKIFCCVLFVPEHLDGIGDFAEAALRGVPAHVLDQSAAATRSRLQDLAGSLTPPRSA